MNPLGECLAKELKYKSLDKRFEISMAIDYELQGTIKHQLNKSHPISYSTIMSLRPITVETVRHDLIYKLKRSEDVS